VVILHLGENTTQRVWLYIRDEERSRKGKKTEDYPWKEKEISAGVKKMDSGTPELAQ